MKQNKILLSILFAFLLIVIPSKALALTNLTQEDFDEVNEEKGLTYHELEDTPGYLKLESGEYVLDEDIMLPTYIVVDEENEVTFDLNGKKIFNSNANETLVFGVDGKLTLTGKGIVGKKLEVLSPEEDDDVVMIVYHGEVTIEDAVFNGVIQNFDGDLTINNGTFNDNITVQDAKLTINNGTFNGISLADSVDVEINGGKFYTNVRDLGFGININEEVEEEPTEEEIDVLRADPAIVYRHNEFYGGLGDDNNEPVGSIVINDGEFNGSASSIYLWDIKDATINGGTFNSHLYSAVVKAENIKIAGGLFKVTEDALFKKYAHEPLRTSVALISENIELSGGKYVNDTDGHTITIDRLNNEDTEESFEDILKEGYIYSDEISVKHYGDEEGEDLYNSNSMWYLENQEILVIPEEGEYEILDGADQEVKSGSNLIVRASGDISLFVKLLIDDKEVARDNYELTEGSTIVTLNSSFLANLSSGKHTMTFVYKNGEVETSFTINDAKNSDASNNEKNPSTGDNILLYVGLLSLSVVGLVSYKLVRKAN